VARLMRQSGIRPEPMKRFVVTTDSKHTMPVAQNVLGQQFDAREADTRWAADITYIWTRQGWLYLSVVLDLFSRKVVGWSVQPTLERRLVTEALSMALLQRLPEDSGLLCHSDRGSQYASADYQALLKEAGLVCSMSRRGNCLDNAPVESFFSTLKRELVHRRQYATREEARADIFRWIEIWYNRKRRHSALGYISPEAYEQKAAEAASAVRSLPMAA
jgi:putative transposase